jgi:hypothetical protein
MVYMTAGNGHTAPYQERHGFCLLWGVRLFNFVLTGIYGSFMYHFMVNSHLCCEVRNNKEKKCQGVNFIQHI